MPNRYRFLILTIFAATFFAFAARAETPPVIRSTPLTAKENFFEKLFLECGMGWTTEPASFMKLGDPDISQVQTAYGHTFLGGGGIRLSRSFRVVFEREWEKTSGNGAFAEGSASENPYGPAHGNLLLKTPSNMFAGEFDILGKHKLHLYVGGGINSRPVAVYHRFNGTITVPNPDTGGPMTVPVSDQGKDHVWDGTGRVGVRYQLKNNFELSGGVYGKTTLSVKGVIAWYPGTFLGHLLGRN